MCNIDTILAEGCESGILKETDRIQLLQIIAQLLCNLKDSVIDGRPLTGAASPVGVITPSYIGQFYSVISGGQVTALYQAGGLTSANWTQLI